MGKETPLKMMFKSMQETSTPMSGPCRENQKSNWILSKSDVQMLLNKALFKGHAPNEWDGPTMDESVDSTVGSIRKASWMDGIPILFLLL